MSASDESQTSNSKRCVAAAVVLSVAHVLTLVGAEYQVYTPGRYQIDRFFLVNYATFLAPLVILLAFRKVCVALGILAIPVLTFFAWRMYYVWQFYWFGINSMARQKGDELGFFSMVFDMLSLPIAAAILLFLLFYKLLDRIQRARRGD
jgi:hypothetical protein